VPTGKAPYHLRLKLTMPAELLNWAFFVLVFVAFDFAITKAWKQ
jgi:hypothetical protein